VPAAAAAVGVADVRSNEWAVVEGDAAARGGVDAGEGKGFGNVKDDIAKGRFISSASSTTPTAALNAPQKLSCTLPPARLVLNWAGGAEHAIPAPHLATQHNQKAVLF
jgi:hypothetical protein